ncbi:MAG: alpha/beta hydrolase [Chloroflexia bacterium]
MRQRARAQTPHQEGRLSARPQARTGHATYATGLQSLELGGKCDGLLYVPLGYSPDTPAALVVLLHGAGGEAHGGINLLRPLADEANLVLLAPESRASTWDVIRSDYGPDVAFIDRALAQTFDRYAIDPTHLAAGGFSDGASYALSIGLTNGDLFTHILAFSPGFMAPTQLTDRPRIFISHGTRDAVLPINMCSRRIMPQLQQAGYDIDYREFEGPHTVPPDIARAAVSWFTQS